MCLQISESRAKNDLLLGEMNMYLSDYNIANNKGVQQDQFCQYIDTEVFSAGLEHNKEIEETVTINI